MQPIPTDPLINRASPEEMLALASAKGGRSTEYGTSEHDLFERMSERGWVKSVTETGTGVAWRLSGDGLRFAYADEA